MLGWEYPPIVNGGLGVACKGIAENLSQEIDLKVVLPQASTKLDVNSFVGMSPELLGRLKEEAHTKSYKTVNSIEFIDVSLFPYETLIEERVSEKRIKVSYLEDLLDEFNAEEINEISNSDLYGENLALRVVAYAKLIKNYLRLNHFDLVYAHDWMTFFAALEVKKHLDIPYVAHVHSLCYDRSGVQDKGWIYQVEQKAMSEAKTVIAVSNYTKGVIKDEYHIDPEKIKVVHNGITHMKMKREEKPFPEKLVLFLGRVTSQKGPELFLEIADRVRQRYRNVRFVMAGDGDQLKKVIETGAYRSIGDRFHFTGFLDRERINLLLEMADVFCMPSVSEPFGLSAIEAAQYGIPAVISKQSGVLEVLDHALSANHWESKRFAEHIIDILENEELAAVLSVQLRKDIKEVSWENTASNVLEVLEEAING